MSKRDNPFLAFVALAGLGLGAICHWQYYEGHIGLAATITGMIIGGIVALAALLPGLVRKGGA